MRVTHEGRASARRYLLAARLVAGLLGAGLSCAAQALVGATARAEPTNHPALSLGSAAAADGAHWSRLSFDPQGRLKRATLPASGSTQLVHDRAGRLRFWMDANGAAATPQRIAYRRYDAQGRVLEEGDVEGRFDQGLLSRLAEHVDEPSGAQRQWRRRLVYGAGARNAADGPLVEVQTRDMAGAVHVQRFRYDAAGHVTAVTESLDPDEPALETRYRHDERGRIVRVDGPAPVGEADPEGIVYAYDAQDRLVAIGRHQRGRTVADHYATYAYGPDGRLRTEVRNPTSRDGRIVLRYVLDKQGRLTSLSAVVGGRQRFAQALGYDAATGLIRDMRQTYTLDGQVRSLHWRPGQDADGLHSARHGGGERLVHDIGTDDRLLQVRQAGASEARHAYAYDADGNVLRKTGHIERIDIDPFFNRPVSVAVEARRGEGAAPAPMQLRYGGLLAQRVSLSYEAGPPAAASIVQQAYFRGLSDPPLMIRRDERRRRDGSLQRSRKRLVWGPAGLVAVSDDASGSAVDHFVVGNHQSSTVMVLRGDGALEASYAYTPAGRIHQGDGTPVTQEQAVPYLFQGQEYDWQSGLHNFGARLYDSDTVRFLSPDPLPVAGQSPYVAMNGDPVNYEDPDGALPRPSRWRLRTRTIVCACTAGLSFSLLAAAHPAASVLGLASNAAGVLTLAAPFLPSLTIAGFATAAGVVVPAAVAATFIWYMAGNTWSPTASAPGDTPGGKDILTLTDFVLADRLGCLAMAEAGGGIYVGQGYKLLTDIHAGLCAEHVDVILRWANGIEIGSGRNVTTRFMQHNLHMVVGHLVRPPTMTLLHRTVPNAWQDSPLSALALPAVWLGSRVLTRGIWCETYNSTCLGQAFKSELGFTMFITVLGVSPMLTLNQWRGRESARQIQVRDVGERLERVRSERMFQLHEQTSPITQGMTEFQWNALLEETGGVEVKDELLNVEMEDMEP